jgi:hypothetical protein
MNGVAWLDLGMANAMRGVLCSGWLHLSLPRSCPSLST